MSPRKAGSAILFALALAVSFSFSAKPALADNFNQSMKLTFTQPMQVPGKVLPAGTYWFDMKGGHSDPSGNISDRVMSVWNTKRTHVIATFTVLPTPTVKDAHASTKSTNGHIVITVANRSPEPLALMDLTYPGRVYGQDFTFHYPKAEQKTLSDFPRVTMQVGRNGVVRTTDTHTTH